MKIGEIIRDRRMELNMTQEDLAKAVDTTKATVSRWESGEIHKIRESMIRRLCAVLQISPMIFFQREEVLMPDEAKVIDAYRIANEGIRPSVRILLNVKEEET